MMYKPCEKCAEFRAEGSYEAIINCGGCKGKGLIRIAESYVCNCCGEGLCRTDDADNGRYPMGLVEAKVGGSYNSFHLMDLTTYQFSICEKCLRTLFNGFKIPPTVWDTLGSDDPTYAEDLDYYNFRLWEKAGGPNTRLLEGGCNYRESCTEKAAYRHLGFKGHLTNNSRCETHKFQDLSFQGRLVPLESVPFLKAETQEQLDQVASAWKTGVELELPKDDDPN